MVTLTERTIMKSRSGVYSDTAENRRKHRVGQKYGAEKQPEDGEKTEKKEDDPAKELEAVNKVIAAISEGKLTLPNDQIMVLVEKKSKLEAAKKQAEKINAGVKAKYEERLKQAKDEVSKLKGEKPKESQKSEYFDRTGYKPIYRMNEEEADKFISDAKKYLSENKDAKDVEQVQDAIRKVELRKEEIKETSNEEAEVYTRIKFEDVPNSGKINLKKYLSEKVRKGVDEKWSNIKNIPTENLKKMEKGLVNDLNKNFEAIKKSQRAELLYSIMKVKGELEKRGKESQKKE